MRDVIHAVDGPGPEFFRRIHALEAAVAELLRQRAFEPGMGEPLDFVAGDLVAHVEAGADTDGVARRLQAFAAPASSHVPPIGDFVTLAAEIVALVASLGSSLDANE